MEYLSSDVVKRSIRGDAILPFCLSPCLRKSTVGVAQLNPETRPMRTLPVSGQEG